MSNHCSSSYFLTTKILNWIIDCKSDGIWQPKNERHLFYLQQLNFNLHWISFSCIVIMHVAYWILSGSCEEWTIKNGLHKYFWWWSPHGFATDCNWLLWPSVFNFYKFNIAHLSHDPEPQHWAGLITTKLSFHQLNHTLGKLAVSYCGKSDQGPSYGE